VFTFDPSVPASLYAFLVPLLQAWIDRSDHQVFGFETTRYGLVSFSRIPWPLDDTPTVVAPAGEVDIASLWSFAHEREDNPDTATTM
jgi:hypothetical protein